MESALDILREYWHYDSFRDRQEFVINAVASGQDVLALLPTGGGKSICFQIPAMMKTGCCIVITPLIALMKDQVEHLSAKGISACAIHSGLSTEEVRQILSDAESGLYKFLYVSPERLDTVAFKNACENLTVNLIAVDEAHCISQWGYDFRPAYLEIAELRTFFPETPVIALTASATPEVQKDICEKLLFKNYQVFKGSFHRENLAFEVKHCDNKLDTLAKILSQQTGSAIVYCKTRRITQDISRLLNIKNLGADYYHAGLSQESRAEKQDKWMRDQTRVIVCTNAFGMGIDKPNVSSVIHYDTPDCLENYYQEAGRAGRDGNVAQAVLLYVRQDIEDLESLKDVRFPLFSEIKKVYRNICDYLQIPVGSGEGNFYDFDFNTFIKNFKLNAVATIYAVKALEQAGFISFNENIFLPSKVVFTIDRESLYDFENNYAQYEPIIKCLLRSYEGISAYRVSVFERQIARLISIPVDSVVQQLQSLHRMGIIHYLPQKDTPQLFFLTDRAPAEFLHFDHSAYLKRKKIFSDRVDKMIEYIYTDACRSNFISHYFGDENTQPCGICDNCRKEKKQKLSADDFGIISSALFDLLKQNVPVNTKYLTEKLQGYSVDKIKETIRYLQKEEKIKVDFSGTIQKS